MGGGDLNLKKSWHPHTLKNQKRVYEAEQADAAEKRKMYELQREIQNERNFEELKRIGQSSGVLAADDKNRLEWMYKGAEKTLNREEYLTGRAIDKHFEDQDKNERQKDPSSLVGVTVPKNHVEHECIPFSIRAFRAAPASEEQVDLQRKIMEDPLMMIQQKEMETRQKLLQNPVKLKEIHRLLQQDQKLKDSSSHKKKKKSKKSKKKRSHSGSDDSDEDLDSKLAKKYKKLLGDKSDKPESLNIDKLLNEKYEKLSSELDKIKKSKKKDKKSKSKKKRSNSSSSSRSDSSDDEAKKRMASRREAPKNWSDRNDDRRKISPQRNRFNRRSRSPFRNDRDRGNNPRFNNSGRDRFGDSRRKSRSRSRSPRRDNKNHPIERRQRSRSPRSSRNFNDRFRNSRRDERDNNRSQRNRHNDRRRSKSRSESPKRKPSRRHSRSRSRSHSRAKQTKNMNSFDTRNKSKTPEKSGIQKNESNDHNKNEPERAVRTAALPPKHSSSSSSSSSSSDQDSGSDDERKVLAKWDSVSVQSSELVVLTSKIIVLLSQRFDVSFVRDSRTHIIHYLHFISTSTQTLS